jgi:hypothetical protein
VADGHLYHSTGDPWRIALLGEALAGLDVSEPRLRVRLLARLAQARAVFGPDAENTALLDEARALAAASEDPADEIAVVSAHASVLVLTPAVAERGRVLERLQQLATAADDPVARLDAATGLVSQASFAGEPEDVVQAASRDHARLAEDIGRPSDIWLAHVREGSFRIWRGEWDAATRLADEARALGERLEIPDALPGWAVQQYAMAWTRGRVGEVADLARLFVDVQPQIAAWRAGWALGLGWSGDRATAAGLLGEVLEMLEPAPRAGFFVVSAVVAAEAAWLLGDRVVAERLAAMLAPWSGCLITVGATLAPNGPVDRHLGRLAALLGDTGEGLRLLERARRACVTSGVLSWEPHVVADLAAVHALAGAPGPAAAARQEAEDLAARLDLALLPPPLDHNPEVP